MKYFKYSVAILTIFLVLSGCGKLTIDKKNVAVNEQKILDNDRLPKASKAIKTKEGTKVTVKEIETYEKEHSGKNLTRRYIVGLLLDEKYKLDDQTINTEEQQLQSNLGDNYESYLTKNNLTKDTLREELKYRKQVYQLGVDSLDITDGNLKKIYDSWVPSMTIQHIMVQEEATINEVKQKLADGADFTELVKEYSIDEQTKSFDGRWENLKQGDLLSSLEEPVSQLKDGETSSPIKTIMGWHMVKMLNSADKKPYEEVKEQVKQEFIQSNLTPIYLEETIDQLIENEIKPLDSTLKQVLGIGEVSSERRSK